MTLAEQFGRRLRLERRLLGVTQESLARSAGLHRTAVGLLENGHRAPGLVTIVSLAKALGIDAGRLVQGLEPEPEGRPQKRAPARRMLFVPFAGGEVDP